MSDIASLLDIDPNHDFSKSIGDLMADAIASINSERDRRINAGLEYPPLSGTFFDSDAEAQKNVNGAATICLLAQSAGQPFAQDWITRDNSVVTLDAVGITGLGMAIGHHVGFHRLQARAYKDMVSQAATREDIAATLAAYLAIGD